MKNFNFSKTIGSQNMLTLYYAKNSCAFAPHVVLEDAQADYKTVLIDIKNGEQNSDAYKKINMKQRVPALQTQKGILTETPAIMTYIAQEHPKKNLIPHDNYLFAKVQSFNLYLASTVHVAHAHKHRGTRWATDQDAISHMTSKVQRTMTDCGKFIESCLIKGPWVLGERYSICDPYLALITRWLKEDGVDLSEFPLIRAHHELINKRDSMKKVLAIHNS